ncbi:hypothetical protein LWI29_022715 [Acer saccharum]|uniref:DUF4283 domain-containing protein n=1 Tax=Acer saccharum TaxID=4024 RepID=A0AA39SQB3_ACESA|nr:hypothetical protein LWI29_022715 [Acer saccharum]
MTPQSRLSWAEFRGIPLHCWCEEFFKRLGWAVGEPLLVDEETLKRKKLDYGKILVLIPYGQSCPDGIKVISGSSSFSVAVWENPVPDGEEVANNPLPNQNCADKANFVCNNYQYKDALAKGCVMVNEGSGLISGGFFEKQKTAGVNEDISSLDHQTAGDKEAEVDLDQGLSCGNRSENWLHSECSESQEDNKEEGETHDQSLGEQMLEVLALKEGLIMAKQLVLNIAWVEVDTANVAACINSSKPLCGIVGFIFDDVQALCKDAGISKCHAIFQVGNHNDRTSISAYVIFLGSNTISWCSRKQHSVARSSTEVEYRAVAHTASEVVWLSSLLRELHIPLTTPPTIYCDNIGATYLCSNHVFHSQMKHIAIDFHFVQEKVQNGQLRVSHVASANQLANSLTKPLSRTRFSLLRSKIGLLNAHHLKRAC